jgi:hypothetical protein
VIIWSRVEGRAAPYVPSRTERMDHGRVARRGRGDRRGDEDEAEGARKRATVRRDRGELWLHYGCTKIAEYSDVRNWIVAPGPRRGIPDIGDARCRDDRVVALRIGRDRHFGSDARHAVARQR